MAKEGIYPNALLRHLGVWIPAFAGDDPLQVSPLLRKPVRPALRDAALEGGAGVHPRQPRAEIRIGPELVEYFRHLANKTHLDVDAGQRLPDKEFFAPQRAVDIAEMVGHLAVDARMQGRARLLQPRDIEV